MKGVECELRQGTLTARVYGELDHRLASAIRCEIDRKVFEARPEKLVLDISGTDFMDSSGLGLIMGRYRLAMSLGCEFCLTGVNSGAMRLLRMAGLDKTVKITKENENEKDKGE